MVRLLGHVSSATSVALNNALAHERFQQLAAVDGLTGAYNRRFGVKRLKEEWARAVREDTPLGVLTFDLDHFKAVNDTFGHAVGDRVLRAATAAARMTLREGDMLARIGGEEFLVVLPGAGPHDVHKTGERIRHAVRAATVPAGTSTVQVTTSLGGAASPEARVDTPEQLLEQADQALYSAKRNGRDQLVMATPAVQVTSS